MMSSRSSNELATIKDITNSVYYPPRRNRGMEISYAILYAKSILVDSGGDVIRCEHNFVDAKFSVNSTYRMFRILWSDKYPTNYVVERWCDDININLVSFASGSEELRNLLR